MELHQKNDYQAFQYHLIGKTSLIRMEGEIRRDFYSALEGYPILWNPHQGRAGPPCVRKGANLAFTSAVYGVSGRINLQILMMDK